VDLSPLRGYSQKTSCRLIMARTSSETAIASWLYCVASNSGFFLQKIDDSGTKLASQSERSTTRLSSSPAENAGYGVRSLGTVSSMSLIVAAGIFSILLMSVSSSPTVPRAHAESLGPWLSTSDYPSPVQDQSCVASDGYVYCIGGCTSPQRTISLSSDAQLTAVYSCSTSTIDISAASSTGAPLAGYYATVSLSNGTLIQACLSPCAVSVDNGQNYLVTAANFGSEKFTNWSDGQGVAYSWGGSHIVAVPAGSNSTAISLVAVYSP
jgi:hypothetical protein